jgi:hypothetical protein
MISTSRRFTVNRNSGVVRSGGSNAGIKNQGLRNVNYLKNCERLPKWPAKFPRTNRFLARIAVAMADFGRHGIRRPKWQKKSARWKSPRKSQRALCFRSRRRSPGPFDFPPEIKTKHVGLARLRLASQSAEASRNDRRMPENQAVQSIFRGRIRSCGRKTGRKSSFSIFHSTKWCHEVSSTPFSNVAVHHRPAACAAPSKGTT